MNWLSHRTGPSPGPSTGHFLQSLRGRSHLHCREQPLETAPSPPHVPIHWNMLARCAEAMTGPFAVARVRIWTPDDGETALTLRAHAGIGSRTDIQGAPLSDDAIGRFAAEHRTLVKNDLSADSAVPDREWAIGEQMAAYAAFPLTVNGRLLGMIELFSREPFSDVACGALAQAADQVAVGLDRKRAEALRATGKEHLRKYLRPSPPPSTRPTPRAASPSSTRPPWNSRGASRNWAPIRGV